MLRVEFDAARSDGDIETYGMTRVSVLLPEDLVAAIDEFAGPRGRGAFLAEAAREALNRRRAGKELPQTAEPEDVADVFVPGAHDASEDPPVGRSGY
jgi:hypothetical protein